MNKPALLGGDPVRPVMPQHTTDIGDEERRLVEQVLDSGVMSGFAAFNDPRFHGGHMVQAFEKEVADYFGTQYAVSFNSATSALHAAVAACGAGPGDEVITSPTTMTATAAAILHTNAIPVFADIEASTYGLDPDCVAANITPQTRGILAVNLYGQACRLDELKRLASDHNLFLIEDNCHAPSASYQGRFAGTIGQVGILSLNYHKIFQCGEGGVALTDDDDLALKMKLIRNHGESVVESLGCEDLVNTLGWNYRMTEIQAAVALAQFRKMDRLIGIRRELAQTLTDVIAGFDFLRAPVIPEGQDHVFYLYPIRYRAEKAGLTRKLFCEALRAENFTFLEGYITPLHLQPLFKRQMGYGDRGCPFTCPYHGGPVPDYSEGSLPVAESLWRDELIVATFVKYPNTKKDMCLFGTAIDRILKHKEALRAFAETE